MREQLIRYLLGELDAEERRELQTQLRDNPELRRELEQLRECFAASDLGEEEELPPPGSLAERTAQRVQRCDDEDYESLAASSQRCSSAADPPSGVLGWSLADLTVAGGVMLAVSMLVFPALRDSREGTRLTVCQERQQQLYVLSLAFAENHFGLLPPIRPNENAGMFPARLIHTGIAEPQELAVLLICPASQVANDLRAKRAEFKIPDRTTLVNMDAEQLMKVTAVMSPCFAYRFPHKSGDGYAYLTIRPPRIVDDETANAEERRLAFQPLLSDNFGTAAPADGSGHRGAVIQMTGIDGSGRRFCAEGKLSLGFDDDLFHNDAGLIAAGMRPNDVVLGSSNAKPGLDMTAQGR
jgi:hypothetical protein